MMFSLFIFLFGILTIWHGMYALQGAIKALTAIMILPIIPSIMKAFEHMAQEQQRSKQGSGIG